MAVRGIAHDEQVPATEPTASEAVWIKQHSLRRSLALHLLPGALITVFIVAALPIVRSLGFPSIMTLYLAIVVVLVPFQLGYLLYRARHDGISPQSLVNYREPVPRGQSLLLVVGLFAWSGLIFVLVFPPLDDFFITTAFAWVPAVFFFNEDFDQYSTTILLITWTVGLILNGFVGPIMEEIYFRGHLLPRISRFGAWAPVLNTVLFSVYHFFTPWQNLSRIIWALPMISATWWKRNIYLSMTVHVLSNVAGMLLMLPLFFG
jgi:uncharacterized protein